MERYRVPEILVKATLDDPDVVLPTRIGRKIARKALNGHVLRVIYEHVGDEIIIVTVYRARKERYEV